MSEWHCNVGDTKYGPVSLEVLREWLAQGRLKPTDLVWTDGLSTWQPAGTVPELAGTAPQAAAPAAGMGPAQPIAQAAPQAYYPGPLPNAPGAVASLVCGIIGVVLCWACGTGVVLGIIAIYQCKKAKQMIALNFGRCGGGGLATAGLVLGIIGIVMGAFYLIYFIVLFSTVGFMSQMHRF